MLDRQMKLLLRIGAAIIALSAVIALASPSTLAKALALPLDLDPEIIIWNIRISGALLLPLAGFMALAAAFFPERALRQSGALMVAFFLYGISASETDPSAISLNLPFQRTYEPQKLEVISAQQQ